MYQAYQQGRAERNPAEFWYNGEIGFFDFYILPLARKLKECGVFGVSSDEYLNYALRNRNGKKDFKLALVNLCAGRPYLLISCQLLVLHRMGITRRPNCR